MQTSSSNLKTGGMIKTYCTRCKLDLIHTIVAMMGSEPARVECNTCRSPRNYRAPKVVRQTSTRAQASKPAVTKTTNRETYVAKINAAPSSEVKAYRIDASFELGQLVQHSKFGKGVVTKIIHPDRVEILFEDQARTLSCAPISQTEDTEKYRPF